MTVDTSLAAILGLPAIGFLIASRARSAADARVHALFAMGGTAAMASFVFAAQVYSRSSSVTDGLVGGLVLDEVSAPLPLLASIVALAVLSLAPRKQLTRAAILDVLYVAFSTLLVFLADRMEVAVLAAVAGTLPLGSWVRAKRDAATTSSTWFLLLLGGVPLLLALAWVGRETGNLGGLLFDSPPPELSSGSASLVLGLVAAASMVRMAVFPGQRWLIELVRGGLTPRAIMLFGPLPGAYLLLRFGVMFPDAFAADLPWLAAIGLVSALYFAFVSMGQEDQREGAIFLVLSQVSLVFLGLAEADTLSVDGALVLWIAQGVAGTGLILCASAVRSRRGPVRLARFHGLVRGLPHLSVVYFLFGIGVVGFPGTLTFIAEDLIAQGILVDHPWLAAGYVVATALDAIVFLRLYGRVFLGGGSQTALGKDLSVRERTVALALAATVIVAGIVPYPLVAMRSDFASDFARADAAQRVEVADEAR